MKGKMLMFAKISIQSFNYDLTDVFMFPNAETKKIYDKYKIIKCNLVQNLTDTDSMFLTFIFICEPLAMSVNRILVILSLKLQYKMKFWRD